MGLFFLLIISLSRDDHIAKPFAVGIFDVIGQAGGYVDHVAFCDVLFAVGCDEDAPVFENPEAEFYVVITSRNALLAGLYGFAVDEGDGF